MPQLMSNGISLAYKEHGDGDPLLLVCGTGQAAASWSLSQLPGLVDAGYRVITFDNRGMPPSACPPEPYSVDDMVADTTGLIEELEIGPCLVAGWSLGAFIAQELALARSDLVRGAAMIGTIGRQPTFTRALFGSWVDLDRSGAELPTSFEVVSGFPFLYSSIFLADDERASLFLEFGRQAPRWEQPGRLGQHQADATYDNRLSALANIRVPCLVLGFELDVVTPCTLGAEVAATIPGARYLEFPGLAHGGLFENPDAVNTALVEFFRTC